MRYIESKDVNKEAHSKIVNDLLNKTRYYKNSGRTPYTVRRISQGIRCIH